jgi:hypothetical protein
MISTTIHHIVVMPSDLKEENFTFFQGFSREIAMDYGRILSCLSWVPHDILESRLDLKSLVASKMMGSSLDINHVNENLLDDMHVNFSSYFTFIWSTEKTIDKAIEVCNNFAIKPVHISCKKHRDAIHIDDIDESIITDAIENLRELVMQHEPNSEISQYLAAQEKAELEKRPFPFPPLIHNCTIPSAKALIACGYEIREVENVEPSADIGQHSKGIIKITSLIDDIRTEYDFPASAVKNDVIIFCSSIYAHLYKPKSKMWVDLYRFLSKVESNFIKNALVRNKGYSNVALEVDGGADFNPYENKVVGSLLSDRQLELSLFEKIVSILSSNQFCPAIRLPNGVMLHHDLLSDIALLIRSPSLSKEKNLRKLNKKLKSYGEVVRKDIGEELFNKTFESRAKILSICDFPIEWISINGFPLMFTHEISRIFPTPGNMLGPAALGVPRIIIPYSAITDILVIRSFDSSDPIKDHLSKAMDKYSESGGYDNIKIKMVDVYNEQQLIDTLNEYGGRITIFDCHGGHGVEEGYAWLHVGDEKLDVWSLANKCRIPPVVVLSACSTHPVDGSHASVANGLFRCGAVSVLGTYAPVNAIHAGQFVARLLYRISKFVPMLIEHGIVSWREVIAGLLRMSYVTDVLMGMRDTLKLINEEQYTDIHVKANCLINSSTKNWQDEFIVVIEELSGLDEEKIRSTIFENFQFVETMLYSQLGRPENIFISKDTVSVANI